MSERLDECLRSLSSRENRIILRTLNQHGSATMDDLETELPESAENVALSLKHFHLPQLEEHGHIDWNRKTGDVSPGAKFGEVKSLLELFEANADDLPFRWP